MKPFTGLAALHSYAHLLLTVNNTFPFLFAFRSLCAPNKTILYHYCTCLMVRTHSAQHNGETACYLYFVLLYKTVVYD